MHAADPARELTDRAFLHRFALQIDRSAPETSCNALAVDRLSHESRHRSARPHNALPETMTHALQPFAAAAKAVGRRLSGQRRADSADLTRIRHAMLERVLDCELKTVRRIRMQLADATSAVQLWLLRSEIYQAISEQFGQAEAALRVESLRPLFQGFLPAKQLRAI